jgi:hypothetical protein
MGSQTERLLRPYVGKWMYITGKIADVKRSDPVYTVLIKVEDLENPVIALFSLDKAESLHELIHNQIVRVEGKFQGLELGFILLKECEIVESR